MLGLIAAAVMAVGAADPAQGPTQACRDAHAAHWEQVLTARQAERYAEALVHLAPIESACGSHPALATLLAVVHADTDVMRGAPEEAVRRLDQAAIGAEDGMWARSRWVYLAAFEGAGEAERFRQTRDALLAAHDALLSVRGKKIERFETEAAVVDAYQTDIVQGPGFRRLLVFVAAPKNGGMPATLVLTDSPATALIGSKGRVKSYALDLYPCDGHATMTWMEGEKNGRPPPYETVKPHALQIFASTTALPGFEKREAPRFCAFDTYMLPGFDND